MSNETTRNSIGVKTLLSQLIKQYFVLDSLERITAMYEAPTEAAHGDACIVTYYNYASPTSFKVVKMREDRATWDSSWNAA